MNTSDVKKAVQDAYGINVDFIEKIKNVYKIQSEEKQYCLKLIKYKYSHFLFILSAIKYLQHNGFKHIPQIIKTKKELDYISIRGYYAYLTEWVTSRQCDYDDLSDISIATLKLAELHEKSRGFNVNEEMNPRIGWFKWIDTFKTRENEILDFKKRIYAKGSTRTTFDTMYLTMMEEELKRAEKSIGNLIKSSYLQVMGREVIDKGFCHHDYANHNILMKTNGDINIIDFDYCMLDTHLHDLSSLLIRSMKHGKWNINNALFILETYNAVNKIEAEEIPIMAAFMEFPQDYWQVGIQYYWEKQPWGEDFFIKKLKKLSDDKDGKQDFIEKFRYLEI